MSPFFDKEGQYILENIQISFSGAFITILMDLMLLYRW